MKHMKNATKLLLLLLIGIFLGLTSYSQTNWPESKQSSKPWTRWWWPNNAVDKENIKRELQEFAEAGIGGVEITPIYGVKGEEHRDIEFLSSEFTGILAYTIKEANKLGLGVDLPPGSGWRCGGPFVPYEKGLWNLRVEKVEVKIGKTWNPPTSKDDLAAVSFLADDGEKRILNPDEKFHADKSGTIYTALRIRSGNKVKRPAKGGEGWAIDTFNKEITDWYLSEFWKRLGIDEGQLRCFFHDSFEYTGDFTTEFLEEFKKRRGYELAEFLYVLAGDCVDNEVVARVKSDYRETLADLVLESFIQPMTNWANQHKSLNRNQAHGSPGNILDLYAACDIPETEIFQTLNQKELDVFVNKFASSAAHITGKKLVSSESYTWLQEHWTVTPSDLVQATNRFFLAGINHMFFHGTCYSPSGDDWPGWLFYASTQLNNRNPLWRDMPTLFQYIQRTQTVLQASESQNDLLIYWPYFDVAASEGRIFNHIGVNKDAGWFDNHPISAFSKKLMNAGYTFDYISDKQLQNCKMVNGQIVTSGETFYKAVVVPKTEYIPVETLHQLEKFIADGGKVYFDEYLPKSVPGMFDLEAREKILNTIKSKIAQEKYVGNVVPLLEEGNVRGEKSLAEKGFHFLKMKLNAEDVYMIFNTGTEIKDEWIILDSDAKSYVIMNPMTGEISLAETKDNAVRIQLDQEQSVFVRCSKKKKKLPVFAYQEKNSQGIDEGLLWKVEFIEGGPVYPGNLQLDDLVSWTRMGDQHAERFAGTVKYSTEFYWDKESSTAFIDLGKVKDCARLKLNGKTAGTALGPVFKIKVDNLVKGNNSIEIEVTNVAANRIRDLDIRGIVWRKFLDINLVNIDYKPFDASNWEIKDAGLFGPVTIYTK
ncbi:glycosyl hydrolase [Draconibacterium sp.]|nr:glycosyl hydrolase [Draconibacterium sp.]